jgi:hypothetical protein
MLSRGNKIRGFFITAGLILYAATDYHTELSDMARHALLMLIGVMTPVLLNNYFSNQKGN